MMASIPPRLRKRSLTAVMATLFFSGAAGIINQVVWQRALKVFLGGSEALSSMTVVLVFMLGLGAGSAFMSRRASRLRNPAEVFARVEIALMLMNLLIAGLFCLDISQSIYTFQRVAVAAGVPLRLLYAVSATIVLTAPCFLMGTTMPISSEVCQRQLGCQQNRLIGMLFCVNTSGAVVGAFMSGFYLLPNYGQFASLIIAAAGNAVAGLLLFATVAKLVQRDAVRPVDASTALASAVTNAETQSPSNPVSVTRQPRRMSCTTEEMLGFMLGLLALGYEMYLFRINTLIWLPVPRTFALTLCLFLLFWSIGVYFASVWKLDFSAVAISSCLIVAVLPFVFELQRSSTLNLFRYAAAPIYFAPCVCFGMLYGLLVGKSARNWGRDVGRFYAFNTVGSCLGILLFTLVGYEMDPDNNAWIIASGMLLVLFHFLAQQARLAGEPTVAWRFAQLMFCLVIAGYYTTGLSADHTVQRNGTRSYYGRDGVIEIAKTGMMSWDGLQHSYLSLGKNYIAGYHWYMATLPVLAHNGSDISDAAVIGLGCGITTSTLAKLDSIEKVDVYDINQTLKRLLRDLPAETQNVIHNPRVNITWMDGRSGLALNPKKYDIITQQPLYLSQAGSSILLSCEYMQLVKSRLKPRGVFCIYSYTYGDQAQNMVVRQTAKSVFRNCASFIQGYLIVASDDPIDVDAESWNRKIAGSDEIFAEIRMHEEFILQRPHQFRFRTIHDLYDFQSVPWNVTGHVITDNHPIVEYPNVTARLIKPKSDARSALGN